RTRLKLAVRTAARPAPMRLAVLRPVASRTEAIRIRAISVAAVAVARDRRLRRFRRSPAQPVDSAAVAESVAEAGQVVWATASAGPAHPALAVAEYSKAVAAVAPDSAAQFSFA